MQWLVTIEAVVNAPNTVAAEVMMQLWMEKHPAVLVCYQVMACEDDQPDSLPEPLPL